MSKRRLEVEDLSAAEIQHLIWQAVSDAFGPLQQSLQDLREQLRNQRKVITHKEAPAFFNYDVQPETVIRYIKEEGLPATMRGRLYFIRLEDLFEWQLGEDREIGRTPRL